MKNKNKKYNTVGHFDSPTYSNVYKGLQFNNNDKQLLGKNRCEELGNYMPE